MLRKFLINFLAPDPKFRRRVGIALLLAALFMLVAGSELMPKGAHPLVVLFWWLICFVLLILTLVVAAIDMRLIRRSYELKKRELFLRTFRDKEFQKKLREKGRALVIEEGKPPGESSSEDKA